MGHAVPANTPAEVPPGLVYTSDDAPGIRRQRRGKSFCYRRSDGALVSQEHELQRIRLLAIPPAYEHVWICASPRGHLQATGRDAKGRKQYRYHALWRAQRDARKYDRLQAFALALPCIRRRVKRDLQSPEIRRQLLAAVVRLLHTTCGRIGNASYVRANGSYGLTTLRKRHAHVLGDRVAMEFKGKSGVVQHLEMQDARVAAIVRKCRQLRGQTLFSYCEGEQLRSIGSGDVNAYLQAICGGGFSAKDFRTWHGSALALEVTGVALRQSGKPCSSKQMLAAVAQALGNTAAVCRKSYVHPRVLEFAQRASTDPQRALRQLNRQPAHKASEASSGLRVAERGLLVFLRH